VVVKVAIGVFGPLTFTSLRYLIAVATLFLIIRLRTGTIRRPEGTWVQLMLLGVVGFGMYQLVWSLGLTRIPAGDSALIVAVSPVLVALFAGVLGMDRLTPPRLAGALVAFSGVAVVVASTSGLTLGASLVGDLLTLAAAVCWAIYTLLGTRFLRRGVDPLQATAWSVLGGALFLLPFGVFEAFNAPAPPVIGIAAVVAVLYSGAMAAGIANVLIFRAIRVVGPTRVTASQFLVPFGAVILGSLFLSEPIGPAQLVGGAIIVLGIWLTRRRALLPGRVRVRVRGA